MQKNTTFVSNVTINYNQIFEAYSELPFEELLLGIPTNSIVEIISQFGVMIFSDEEDVQLQLNILTVWMGRLPLNVQYKIRETVSTILNAKQIENIHKVRLGFFNNVSALKLIQYSFVNYFSGEKRNLTSEEELRLFKAYLQCSQEWIKEQDKIYDLGLEPNDIIKMVLPIYLPHQEIMKSKRMDTQLIKGILFFYFAEKDKNLSQYLPEFLKYFNVTEWKDYLSNIFKTAMLMLKDEKRKSVLDTDDTNILIKAFLSSISVNLDRFEIKRDYQVLRNFPIYKLNDNKYAFLNFNLFLDKLFQGIQFDYSKIMKCSLPDFKSKFYSKQFAEKTLFYDLVEYMVGKRKKVIEFNGDDLEKILGEEGPDYYIRCEKKSICSNLKIIYYRQKSKTLSILMQ